MGIKDTHHPMRIPDRIHSMWLWHYWYRRLLGWLPIQFCMICGKPYWGGWPRFNLKEKEYSYALQLLYTKGCRPWWQRITCTWQASWQDYCSKKCAHDDNW